MSHDLYDHHSTQLANGLAWAQDEVYRVNSLNGWFDGARTFGDDVALLHSEVSEALEAYRSFHGAHDVTDQHCIDSGKHNTDDNPLHMCKPEGVGSELADVLVRLLDTAQRWNIDLAEEFLRKVRFNETRGYRHGNKAL